ncbi:hypothetical protein HPB49_008624 [Dermacentor silvarum]|uniref:Uncharacterized protein n=1 Tax=Dermacentor silvarum TaxID=543639 RepID=A0ACB8DXH3_DERSI|nr:hypothetical protein HPB49_008624 [Dermacentor silvarum]
MFAALGNGDLSEVEDDDDEVAEEPSVADMGDTPDNQSATSTDEECDEVSAEKMSWRRRASSKPGSEFHTAGDENGNDLDSLPTLYDYFSRGVKRSSVEEHLSLDEQIIAFKGKLNIKQFVKGKPNTWVFRVLLERKIYAAGTVSSNQTEQLKQEGRGSSNSMVSGDGKIIITRWMDNRAVTMASNVLGKDDEDEVSRWSNVDGAFINVKRLAVVRDYNRSMGCQPKPIL